MLEARLDPQDLSALYRTAREAEGTVQVELRRGIKKAAQPIVDAVKSAASFSRRIPGAVKVATRFPKKGASVSIYVDPKKAPHAAPIDNHGDAGTFRHPVFGNRDNWVDQQAIPFFFKGAQDARPRVEAEMLRVMDEIAHQLGFH